MPSIQTSLMNLFMRNVVKPMLFRSMPIEEMRALAANAEKLFRTPRGVSIVPEPLPTCEVDWIIPSGLEGSDRVILYAPGGAFVLRTPKGHRLMTARIAKAASARLALVLYRLAPEFPYPCALQDMLAAYERLLSQGIGHDRIVFGGDSAGGALVHAAIMALRDAGKPLPAGGFSISALTDLTNNEQGSRQSNAELDPMLPGPGHRGIDTRILYVAGKSALLREPYVSPMFGDFHGFPPLLLQVGSTEVLLDDSTLLAKKARAAGVDAEVEVWEQVSHVWHLTPTPESEQAVGHLADFVRRCCP
jgi:acetyl esterase/lipase